jgi:hypothetical protein
METETRNGREYPVVYCRQVGDRLVFECPHCKISRGRRRGKHRQHYHGAQGGIGHRVAHCADGPLIATGYILRKR